MVRVAIKCICNWTSVNCLSLRVYADFIVSSKISFVSFDIAAHIMVPSVFLCMSFLWPVDLMDFWKCSCVTNMMSIDECAPEDCSLPTIVRLSSVGMAQCSLIVLKVPLIQPISLVIRRRSLQCSWISESGTICRRTSDCRTCHRAVTDSRCRTLLFGQWDQSAVEPPPPPL